MLLPNFDLVYDFLSGIDLIRSLSGSSFGKLIDVESTFGLRPNPLGVVTVVMVFYTHKKDMLRLTRFLTGITASQYLRQLPPSWHNRALKFGTQWRNVRALPRRRQDAPLVNSICQASVIQAYKYTQEDIKVHLATSQKWNKCTMLPDKVSVSFDLTQMQIGWQGCVMINNNNNTVVEIFSYNI